MPASFDGPTSLVRFPRLSGPCSRAGQFNALLCDGNRECGSQPLLMFCGIKATMADSDFVFVGYLVQERYVRNWWKREGKRLASLENTVHPSFEKPQWQYVGGVLNHTEFLVAPPDMRSEERRVGKECRSRWSPYH